MEVQYGSYSEPDGSRLQKEATTDDRVGTRESNIENMGNKTAAVGGWGTTFWKDCQPMCPPNGSELAHESKNGSDDNLSEDRGESLDSEDDDDGLKDSGKGSIGHSGIPAEEMLSDEYYEQNGEEQSVSLHCRVVRQPTGSNSRPQQMSSIVKRRMHKSRISDDAEDNDGDADYEEEDEADEDDPDDADFEPSTWGRAADKDKDWEGEVSVEADEGIDVSDNDDSYFDKKAKGRQRGKIERSIRSSKDRKYTRSSRQRRVKPSFGDEDDESTADDSDSESDGDFKSIKKRGGHAHKNNCHSAAPTSFENQTSQFRNTSKDLKIDPIQLDERLGLTKKIAPVELQHHETFLPRAPNLRNRSNALLEQELASLGVKNTYTKVGKKPSKKEREHLVNISLSSGQEKKKQLGSSKFNVKIRKDRLQKPLKVEPIVKEEGEMSDDEEVYEQFKEVKWMEWCQDVMIEEMKTLKRLHRLQTTSANLPTEKVLSKIRNYLQLLGRRINQIVLKHEEEPYKQDRMTTRLWKYVSTFSHLSGERLCQIYSKLKVEQNVAGVGPSHANGCPITDMSQSWKRRVESNVHFQGQLPPQRTIGKDIPIMDPNSVGILGAGPSDQRSVSEKHFRTLPSRQGFSS
ncbi:hypothetical protein JHK82_023007 [Glycine max]|nr:hypothetical protein JHK82_023007 [Glycine max]